MTFKPSTLLLVSIFTLALGVWVGLEIGGQYVVAANDQCETDHRADLERQERLENRRGIVTPTSTPKNVSEAVYARKRGI